MPNKRWIDVIESNMWTATGYAWMVQQIITNREGLVRPTIVVRKGKEEND